MRDMCMRIPIRMIRRLELPLRISGLRDRILYARRQRMSSDRCVWSSHSSDTMFLVKFSSIFYYGCGWLLMHALARVLDEKLKREKQEKMHPSHGTPGSSRKRARGI
jgi:hypothetical protein